MLVIWSSVSVLLPTFSVGVPLLIVTLLTVPETELPLLSVPSTCMPIIALALLRFCPVSMPVSVVSSCSAVLIWPIWVISDSISSLLIGLVGSWFCSSVIIIWMKIVQVQTGKRVRGVAGARRR